MPAHARLDTDSDDNNDGEDPTTIFVYANKRKPHESDKDDDDNATAASNKKCKLLKHGTTSHQNNDNNHQPTLSGAEQFLVGLSPSFWSHIFMTIADVSHLQVVDGVICMIQPSQYIPVSKCTLVGMIVAVEAKAHANSHVYVLDDGTGLVDCLAWGNDDTNTNGGSYALPPLLSSTSTLSNAGSNEFQVGDFVRVWGRVECLSLGPTAAAKSQTTTNGGGSSRQPVRTAMYELHVTVLEFLQRTTRNGGGSDLDWEANHWVKTITRLRPPSTNNSTIATTTTTTINDDADVGVLQRTNATTTATTTAPAVATTVTPSSVTTALDVLEWLGPKIQSDVVHKRNFPSAAEERTGAWKVFGVSCACRCLKYKDALLYCHCQATPESLDPQLVYRDALLSYLLELEENHQQEQTNCNANTANNKDNHKMMDFRFQYQSIRNSRQLLQVAKEVTAQTQRPTLNIEKLVLSTFGALRQDGVIALLDEPTDTYLLISKDRVLMPYIQRCQQQQQQGKRRPKSLPFYLRTNAAAVKARLNYVKKRWCAATSNSGQICRDKSIDQLL